MLLNIPERFWSKIMIHESGCWNWTAAMSSNGYGSFRVGDKVLMPHRYIFYLLNPTTSKELKICHKCDNTKCVNPTHLFPGTMLDNSLDMIKKKRNFNQQKTHCRNGHEFTSENTYYYPEKQRTGNGGGKQRECRTCAKINRVNFITKDPGRAREKNRLQAEKRRRRLGLPVRNFKK